MKENTNFLGIFLVIITILAFVALVIYSFYLSFLEDPQELSPRLTYVANIIIGLVGGIVASAFGVELPNNPDDPNKKMTKYNGKMFNLGSFVTTGRLKMAVVKSNIEFVLGNIYAWVYILVGIAAIVIWATNENALNIIDNLATVSLGLMIVIVKNYFD